MTNIKKIAVLCNYELLLERIGGMDYFFWQFDAKCKENSIEVDWFFPNFSDHGGYPNLNIHSSKTDTLEKYFITILKQNNTVYSHIITHFLELCTPFYAVIKQQSKASIIAVDHNPRPINGYPFSRKIKKKIKGLLYSKYIDTFVGVSDYTAKELVKDFGSQIQNKIQVIHNGILLQDIQERKTGNEGSPSFLTACHLRESKGIQDLIQAVFQLPKALKEELIVDVYGDGPHRKSLENLVSSLGLKQCFRFMGSSPNLNSIYFTYDYLIHPSYEETFCYTVVEALAANTKVLTTNEGGNVLGIITHLQNGFLFDAKDVKQLSFLISQILLRNLQITTETRSDVEKRFSLEKMVDNHFKLLQ